MKWAWNLGRVSGIQLRVHVTFVLLLVWVGFHFWTVAQSVPAMLAGIAFILAIFGCVLLHELGHALTAKRYGITTRDITLLPIGGIARLERMPEDPWQEFWIALAGPAVNVVIAAVLFLGITVTGGLAAEQFHLAEGSFWVRLMLVNVILVVFNLLPAFPMDGGRILRGLLATRLPYARATRIAATLGQAMALFFVFAGLFLIFNPFLLFIALFVWIGAAQEANLAEMRSTMGGVPVEAAMLTDFRTLNPQEPLSHAVDLILAGSQQDFPVVSNSHVVGVLTRKDLFFALAKRGPDVPVEEVMRQDFKSVEASERLDGVFTRLQAWECKTVPILRAGHLVGMLTPENVGEYVMIKSALDESHHEL